MSFGGNTTISTVDQKIGALSIQNSAFGLPIPLFWGKARLSGNLMWYGDFTAIPHTTTQSSGGKGGGGVTSSNTTFTYTSAFIFGLSEGVISSIDQVWSGKEKKTLAGLGMTLLPGTIPQATWPHLTTNHPDEALSYPGIAGVANSAFDLGSQASLPNLSFEGNGPRQFGSGIVDARPDEIVTDLLSSPTSGAGFPASRLSLAIYRTYTQAEGLFLSPVISSQQPSSKHLDDILRATNSAPLWSEGLLKILPYGDSAVTGNGTTYTPAITPEYDLGDDDFFPASKTDRPIKVRRKPPADAYNHVQVEFRNRANEYNIEIADAKDLGSISAYGLRSMEPVRLHGICDAAVAQKVANAILQRILYIRNEYEFRLCWRHCLLEPMDIVTLTHAPLGLDHFPVRIKEIEEDAGGMLRVIAEEFPFGVATPALNETQQPSGYSVDFNIAPSSVNAPVIFEPPLQLTVSSQTEIWIAVSGVGEWGGCEVWASDDDATYRRVGTVYGPARHGVLSAPMASGTDPDATNVLSVDLGVSSGELISGTRDDADRLNTVCYVDGEYVAYQTATLTGASTYDLGYLRRGAYGSTISAHAAGSKFVRLDDAIFKQAVPISRVGSPIYFKFLSLNRYGGGKQGLADVDAYTYSISGAALTSPLPDPANVAANYVAGITRMRWDGVTDFRAPIDYEIRFGHTWAGATIHGRTSLLETPIAADGTWWVAAHYRTPEGVDVYSAAPASVVVAGASLVANVVASYDEHALGWPGSVSGGAVVFDGDLILQGAGDYLASADILAELDILWMGGVSASGSYTNPASHRIDVGRVEACSVAMPYTVRGQSIYDDLLAITDYLNVSDLLGAALGPMVAATPQLRLAQADGVWGAWQNFQPGQYVARHFDGRLLLASSDPQVYPVVSGFSFAVDVEDRIDVGTNVAVAAGGVSVLYADQFNGGSDGAAEPAVQITVLNAQAGDTVVLSAQGLTGFTVQITNGGVGVPRNINWTVKGY